LFLLLPNKGLIYFFIFLFYFFSNQYIKLRHPSKKDEYGLQK